MLTRQFQNPPAQFGSRRRIAALALVVLCSLLGLAFPTQAATPKQVLVVGDSLVGGASNYINFYMSGGGTAQTTIRSVGGTALCDILPGSGAQPWTISSLLAERRYDAVVVAYSGNSITPCMGGRREQAVVDKYRADADRLMAAAQQARVPIVAWVKPPASTLPYVRNGLGVAFESLPKVYPTARVIDGGAGVENANGSWAKFLPCAPWDKAACYAGWVPIGHDDGVHFDCAKRPPMVYGVWQPCSVYSAGDNRYGMNLAATRSFIGL